MNDEIKATDVSGARSVREILATPVGDLVWPGRTSAARAEKRTAEAIIGESALPTEVKDHILEIVRRTRLRRREKADVARELESHFREGMAAGAPPERMLVEFGSARTTARLIRRAKLRCRGWLWHAKVRTLQSAAVCVGVLACVYGYGAARFYGLEANIARNYVAEWNAAALATPEHERGWPKYADGLVALWSGSDMWTRKWPAGEYQQSWTEQGPGSAGWSDVCAWLESRAAAVATLREAALAERMGYVASATWDEHLDRVLEARNPGGSSERLEKSDPNPSLISVLLPQLGEIRSVARVLRLDAQRAAEKGDAATAVADILALTRVAAHARECPTLISELVSVAVSGLACDTVLNVVAARPHLFTAEHLREMAHAIAGMRGGVMHVSIEGERAMFDDVLQRCFSDDGNGDGVLVASAKSFLIPSLDIGELTTGNSGELSFSGPALSLVMAGRREQSEFY